MDQFKLLLVSNLLQQLLVYDLLDYCYPKLRQRHLYWVAARRLEYIHHRRHQRLHLRNHNMSNRSIIMQDFLYGISAHGVGLCSVKISKVETKSGLDSWHFSYFLLISFGLTDTLWVCATVLDLFYLKVSKFDYWRNYRQEWLYPTQEPTGSAIPLRYANCYQIRVIFLLDFQPKFLPYFCIKCLTPSAIRVYLGQFVVILVGFAKADFILGLTNITD